MNDEATPQPKRPKKFYTADERNALVAKLDELRAQGMSVTQAEEQLGLRPGTGLVWIKKRNAAHKAAPDMVALREENEQLKAIIANLPREVLLQVLLNTLK